MTLVSQKLITWPLLRTVGLYLGACWVAVEFADWIVGRYSLPDRVVDLTLIGLLSFTPTVALLGWVHGEAGHQRIRPVEKIAVPTNVVLSAALLTGLILARPAPTAAVEMMTITAPDGESMTRPVVKQELSRGLTLFFVDNATGDERYDWLQYGVTLALDADLVQHPFVKVWNPFSRMEPYHMFQLRKAGYDDGLDVPVALERTIAADGRMEYFVDGSLEVGESADQLDVIVRLRDTATTRVVREIRRSAGVGGADLFDAVDDITRELLEAVKVPAGYEGATDLPVSNRLTDSLAVFEQHVRAVTAQMVTNDRPRAHGLWRQALAQDPSFAVAQILFGRSLFESGQVVEGGVALQTALRHEYKLVDRERFVARGLNYLFRGDRDSELATYETWAELAPQDPQPFIYLANAQLYARSDVDAALTAFERVIELDPREQWVLMKIASLHEVKGNREAAIEYYTRYHDAHPDDAAPLTKLGALHRREGDLDRAARFFDRAAIVANGLVDPTLSLADLAIRQGRYEQALAFLDRADTIAASPRQRAAVLRGRMQYHAHRGQEAQYLALLPTYATLYEQFSSPVDVLMGVWIDSIEHYARAGRIDDGVAELRRQEMNLQPPLNALVDIGYLILSLEIGDTETAARHGANVEAMMETLGLEYMRAYRNYYAGRVSAMEGDLDEAITLTESARRLFTESPEGLYNEAQALQITLQLASYYDRAGQANRARQALEYVLVRYPTHVEANLAMAQLLQRTGDTEGAGDHLDTAMTALAPADPEHPLRLAARELDSTLGT